MLSLPSQSGTDIRPLRHWKTSTAADAVGLVRSGATLGVGWLSDGFGSALAEAYAANATPNDLTIVYSATRGEGRSHGLNLVARQGLVRRVIGGQWQPVFGLQALATTNQIEAYSLPVGVIRRLFRAIAEGQPGHLTRSGLGTFTDPRNGGGRLNQRTWEQLVRLVHPAGDEALLFRGFPIDVAVVGIAFMEGTAAIVMTRDSLAIARAARRCGGVVIAQLDRIGTLDRLQPGQVTVPDNLVDVLVATEPDDRNWDMFSSTASPRIGDTRSAH